MRPVSSLRKTRREDFWGFFLCHTGNHSCVPNAEASFPESNFLLHLTALSDISPGEVRGACHIIDAKLMFSQAFSVSLSGVWRWEQFCPIDWKGLHLPAFATVHITDLFHRFVYLNHISHRMTAYQGFIMAFSSECTNLWVYLMTNVMHSDRLLLWLALIRPESRMILFHVSCWICFEVRQKTECGDARK